MPANPRQPDGRPGTEPRKVNLAGPETKMPKRLLRSKPVLTAAGYILGGYLKFVRKMTRFTFEPADIYARLEGHLPIIVTSWHGQHFLAALMRRPGHDFAVLVSLSPEDALNTAPDRAEALAAGGR